MAFATAAVAFAQWGMLAGDSYRGRGPFNFAALTGRLAANVERSLADESSGPVAQILALPIDPQAEGPRRWAS